MAYVHRFFLAVVLGISTWVQAFDSPLMLPDYPSKSNHVFFSKLSTLREVLDPLAMMMRVDDLLHHDKEFGKRLVSYVEMYSIRHRNAAKNVLSNWNRQFASFEKGSEVASKAFGSQNTKEKAHVEGEGILWHQRVAWGAPIFLAQCLKTLESLAC